MLGQHISLIDTGAAVARQLQRLLDEAGLRAQGPAGETRFWTSGNVPHFAQVLPILWQKSVSVHPFVL